ncbi:sensor histidine kinase [Tumebacillus flagellatus]|uniref:histidine kinase n=1 Tax=Tumebacillus flagellatus TaxID=1157490 RepID=A0A074LUC1_9BACL|nr:ATP-binding protein [Tumebacillus flagellatus]KEO84165.1 hypothetical protein EL26_06780 [Tumebacillus flagellatus]
MNFKGIRRLPIRRFRERLGNLRRKWWPLDPFTRIRLRLTVTYSGMLILILLVFTGIVSAVLFFENSQEQIRQVQTLTDESATLYQDVLQHLPEGGGTLPDSNSTAGSRQFFLYVVDADGNPLVQQDRMPELRKPILRTLSSWAPKTGEVRWVTIHQAFRHGDNLELLIGGRSVYRNGKLAGMLYVGNDITTYWETFKELIKVLLILVGAFGLLVAFFGQRMAARAMVPIKLSYQRQQQFVADASHELRTPLTVLKSSFDVIELEDGENLSDYSKQVFADMKDEVQSMSKLVSDLLTLARSDSGEVDLYEQTFDLADTAEQVVRLRQTLAMERKIELALETPPALSMLGDGERIKQLLAILLDNALKFTPEGGTVTVKVQGESRACVLSVTDTGIGIPEGEQERVFERFYRVEEARSRATGGTGIGLAIAKWIVEAHHGTISVQSKPGEGSTFTARFPLRK